MKKIKSFYYSLFIIHYSLFTIHCYAQQANYNEVVKIVGDYTPTISDAYKINLNPKLQDTAVKAPALNYSIQPKQVNTGFDVEEIKPAKLFGEPLTQLYNSYFRGGFGDYMTPYAEYFYNTLRSKEFSAGLHLKHISSNTDLPSPVSGFPTPNSKYSDNEIGVYGKYIKANNILFGDINYSRNVVHYYGYNPEVPIDEALNEDQKQRFSYIDFDAGIMSLYDDSRSLGHSLMVKYYNLNDLFNASENNICLDGSLSKNISILNSPKIQKLSLNGNGDFYFDNLSASSLSGENTGMNSNSGIIKLIPALNTDFDKLKVNLGLNLSLLTGASSEMRLYPLADVNLNLINEILYAYAGITGETKRNSLKEFSDENPFINTTPNSQLPVPYFQYTNDKFEFYGGIKGNLSSYVNYDASVSASNTDNLPLFVTDTSKTTKNKFTVIYDNAQIVHLKGEISIQETEKLNFIIRGDYYSYTLNTELKAWEMPSYDINLTANYKLNNQITLRAALIGLYQIYAKTYSSDGKTVVPYHLKDIYDINLGADYKFSRQFSAFLNLNNIGNFSYYRWYNYPTQRFNFMLGISCSF